MLSVITDPLPLICFSIFLLNVSLTIITIHKKHILYIFISTAGKIPNPDCWGWVRSPSQGRQTFYHHNHHHHCHHQQQYHFHYHHIILNKGFFDNLNNSIHLHWYCFAPKADISARLVKWLLSTNYELKYSKFNHRRKSLIIITNCDSERWVSDGVTFVGLVPAWAWCERQFYGAVFWWDSSSAARWS